MNENQLALTMETERTMLQLVQDYETEKADLEMLDETSDEYALANDKFLRDEGILQQVVTGIDILQSAAVHTVMPNDEVKVVMLTSPSQQYAEMMYNLTGGFNDKVMETLTNVDKTPFDVKFPNGVTTQESYEQNVNAVLATPEVNSEIQKLMAVGIEPTINDALTATQSLENICHESGLPNHATPEMIVTTVAIKVQEEIELIRTNEAQKDKPIEVVEFNDGVANISEQATAENVGQLEQQGYNEATAQIDYSVPNETTIDDSKVGGRTQRETVNKEGSKEDKERNASENRDAENRAKNDALVAGAVATAITGNPVIGAGVGAAVKAANKPSVDRGSER